MLYVKKTIKWIFYLLLVVVYNPVVKVLVDYIHIFVNFSYTNILKLDLKHLGDGSVLKYPVVLKGGKYITIGSKFSSESRLRIEAWSGFKSFSYKPYISIGNDVVVNFDVHIGAINKIEIGNNVLIGSNVLITDHNHGYSTLIGLNTPPSQRPLVSKGPVIIEDNVWIGEGVVIMPNVIIGSNAVIGANSVVTKNIPSYCIAGGNPARIIKDLRHDAKQD